jgi:hypothetical protein
MNIATIVILQPIDSLHIFEFKVVSEIGYLFVGKSFSDNRDDDSKTVTAPVDKPSKNVTSPFEIIPKKLETMGNKFFKKSTKFLFLGNFPKILQKFFARDSFPAKKICRIPFLGSFSSS